MAYILADNLPTWLPYWIASILIVVSAMWPFWNGLKAMAEMYRTGRARLDRRTIRRIVFYSVPALIALLILYLFGVVGGLVHANHGGRRLAWWCFLGYMNVFMFGNTYGYCIAFPPPKLSYPEAFKTGSLRQFKSALFLFYSMACFWYGLYTALLKGQ